MTLNAGAREGSLRSMLPTSEMLLAFVQAKYWEARIGIMGIASRTAWATVISIALLSGTSQLVSPAALSAGVLECLAPPETGPAYFMARATKVFVADVQAVNAPLARMSVRFNVLEGFIGVSKGTYVAEFDGEIHGFAFVAGLVTPSAAGQMPADLRAAMDARDRAFYAVDAAQWEQFTAANFTTVQQDGSFMTRADRLANLRTQKPRPYVPRSREQNERRGDLVIARFFSGGFWVLEVWSHETGVWQVLMSQVTTAKQ